MQRRRGLVLAGPVSGLAGPVKEGMAAMEEWVLPSEPADGSLGSDELQPAEVVSQPLMI